MQSNTVNFKQGDFLLALDRAEAERRANRLRPGATAAQRLATLFNVPESSFPEGEDVYSCLAAHMLDIPVSRVSKPQRNEVKSRIVEWLYYGRVVQ